MDGKFARLGLLVGVPVLASVAAFTFWLYGGRYVSTENAYVKADIANVAAEISGRVLSVHVQDHDHVAKGDVLITVDPEPFEMALAQTRAELDAARQEVETLRATLAEARSKRAEAVARAGYYLKQARRQRQLAARGIVSASKRDEIENDLQIANERVQVAEQQIRRALASLGGLPDRPVDQHPLVRAKHAAMDQAALNLKRTSVKAPVSGTVVNFKLQPGEHVRAAVSQFAIVSDTRPWVEANFKETELTHVRVGQRATVVLDIYPEISWSAEVESISPATGAEFAILPPQNASGNWVKVVQRLPVRLRLLPHAGAPALRAGMTAEASIDTGRERHLSDILGTGIATAKNRAAPDTATAAASR